MINLDSAVDDEIEDWFDRYKIDCFPISKEVDDWYSLYRKDFMPSVSGRVDLGVKSVQRRVDAPVRNFEYAGHGGVTNFKKCGKFLWLIGCLLHDPIWAFKVLSSCDSPKCSRCVKSWAGRLAGDVAARLVAASEVNGDVEGGVISLRKEDVDLGYKQMKAKCIEILKSCTIHSGYMMLHGKSFGKYRPHFHWLGWVGAVGGAERCRHCQGGDCYACDGIEGRCYKVYQDTGYIVRVFDKRKTIRGTVSYEAKHCTIDYSKRRFRVGVWFGNVAYSNYCNLGVKVEKARLKCPECGSSGGRIDYVGDRVFDLDVDSPNFVRVSREPLVEGGKVVWVVHEFKASEGSE